MNWIIPSEKNLCPENRGFIIARVQFTGIRLKKRVRKLSFQKGLVSIFMGTFYHEIVLLLSRDSHELCSGYLIKVYIFAMMLQKHAFMRASC